MGWQGDRWVPTPPSPWAHTPTLSCLVLREHPLDLGGIARLRQREHQQHARLDPQQIFARDEAALLLGPERRRASGRRLAPPAGGSSPRRRPAPAPPVSSPRA